MLACFLVGLAGVLHELTSWVVVKCDKRWKKQEQEYQVCPSIHSPSLSPFDTRQLLDKPELGHPRFQLSIDVPRALLRMMQFAVSYLLMLIAMTFNVGLCCALVLGIGVGNLLVGRFIPLQTDCCS